METFTCSIGNFVRITMFFSSDHSSALLTRDDVRVGGSFMQRSRLLLQR